LNGDVALKYKSQCQVARHLTQSWARDNLYCVACPSDTLLPTREGTPSIDFFCPNCHETFQLKSLRHPFGRKIVDSAYEPMMSSIHSGTVPNFLFLNYDPHSWTVNTLFAVPKHFFTPSIIEQRKPLSDTARRKGWIGCNIVLSNIPDDGRITLVLNQTPCNPRIVRAQWKRFTFLQDSSLSLRGWTVDVLACVRNLQSKSFDLSEVYTFEKHLQKLHPDNKNIRPKIRQQLQILRDKGIIEFTSRGMYMFKEP